MAAIITDQIDAMPRSITHCPMDEMRAQGLPAGLRLDGERPPGEHPPPRAPNPGLPPPPRCPVWRRCRATDVVAGPWYTSAN